MLALSFLIDSSSKLLVTRTGIKPWSSSILCRIRPFILELLALEWRKFHTFELEYLWSQLVNLNQILFVASLGWGKGCIRWPDWPWHIGLRWAIVALWATCFIGGTTCPVWFVTTSPQKGFHKQSFIFKLNAIIFFVNGLCRKACLKNSLSTHVYWVDKVFFFFF